jgi:hypothetical protein
MGTAPEEQDSQTFRIRPLGRGQPRQDRQKNTTRLAQAEHDIRNRSARTDDDDQIIY